VVHRHNSNSGTASARYFAGRDGSPIEAQKRCIFATTAAELLLMDVKTGVMELPVMPLSCVKSRTAGGVKVP
jgi:hypothetical protein